VVGVRPSPAPVDDLKEEDVPVDEAEKFEASRIPIRALIGRLWWLALTSRPDIYCSVHKCALWQNKPSQKLWKRAFHILQWNARDGYCFQKAQCNFFRRPNYLTKMGSRGFL